MSKENPNLLNSCTFASLSMLCVPPAVGVVVTSVSVCATFVVPSEPLFPMYITQESRNSAQCPPTRRDLASSIQLPKKFVGSFHVAFLAPFPSNQGFPLFSLPLLPHSLLSSLLPALSLSLLKPF